MTSLPPPDIDRTSPVPFYFQLTRLLQREIGAGRWSPGDRLASESELCAHFGVARSTVRQALHRLEAEGLVVREKGRGTFVAHARAHSWMLQSSEGFFTDEVDRLGSSVRSDTLRVEVGQLPGWAGQALGLGASAKGVRLERLRSVDGHVALYVVNCLPLACADSVSALNAQGGSLYDILQQRDGLYVHGGRRTLESVVAGEAIADLLEVDRGAPLAFIESVSWDDGLVPFDCYQAWLRTDRVRIEMQVTRTTLPAGANDRVVSTNVSPV